MNIEEIILGLKGQGYGLFYIDNLGFMMGDKKEIVDTAEVARILKNITNAHGVTINLVHHLNKGGDKDRKKPRGLASIRSSGKLENDADNILQVWRNLNVEGMLPEEKAAVSIILMKDRTYGEPSLRTIFFNRGDYDDVYIPDRSRLEGSF